MSISKKQTLDLRHIIFLHQIVVASIQEVAICHSYHRYQVRRHDIASIFTDKNLSLQAWDDTKKYWKLKFKTSKFALSITVPPPNRICLLNSKNSPITIYHKRSLLQAECSIPIMAINTSFNRHKMILLIHYPPFIECLYDSMSGCIASILGLAATYKGWIRLINTSTSPTIWKLKMPIYKTYPTIK